MKAVKWSFPVESAEQRDLMLKDPNNMISLGTSMMVYQLKCTN